MMSEDKPETTIPDKITLWQGRPIEECSKDQLIAVVSILGRELSCERERHKSTIDFMSYCAKATS
jgi:hypothetical protein